MKLRRVMEGFTLIEIMLAMTLLSIMMVLLFGTLRISSESWEAGEGKAAYVNEAALVYHFFRRHLSATQPLWNDFTKGDKVFSFQGQPDSIQFVSSFPASVGRSGMQLFTIKLLREDGDQVINVSITPFFPVSEEQEWAEDNVVILRNVREFKLSYFGLDSSSQAMTWQENWLEKEELPELVKIKVARNNEIFWPETLISLKSAEAQNEMDVFSGEELEEMERPLDPMVGG